MNNREYGCVRPACYMVNVSMAVVASLSMKLGLSVAIIFPLVASVLSYAITLSKDARTGQSSEKSRQDSKSRIVPLFNIIDTVKTKPRMI